MLLPGTEDDVSVGSTQDRLVVGRVRSSPVPSLVLDGLRQDTQGGH
jgi:hypothetical protein